MKAVIYVEGGGDSDSEHIACREGFRKLFENFGIRGRMPKFVACGSRTDAYDAFKTAHAQKKADYVALLVDAEDPMVDPNKPWEHLESRKDDSMPRPEKAGDDQALVMATCMETWIVADRAALESVYKKLCLQVSALPPLVDLEIRNRHDVQNALSHATRNSRNRYTKGRRSFKTLEEIEPDRIRDSLKSFQRVERILKEKLL